MYTLNAKNMDFGDNYLLNFYFSLLPNAGHGILIREFSKSHTVTHHSR